MIRILAKKLAAFKDFVDFVIVEVNFRLGNFDSGAEILKNHSSMVLIRVSSSEAEILVKMIRPRRKIAPALGCRINFSEKIWRIFTATEIFDFVEEIGDKNKIHRLNPPIVPAMLILETLCKEFPAKSIKLRFKNFIIAGEPLTLTREEKILICAAGVRKISGELS